MMLRKKQILTVPNMLSLIRLLMIPVMAVLYLNGHAGWTAFVLILSGVTDILDGFIARRLNQISDVGKVLDPIADKLTQAVMLICLVSKRKVLLIPFVLLAFKEIFAAVSGIIVIKRTGLVPGAEWHGKAVTMLLYGMMIIHVLWQDIPLWLSNMLIIGCIVMMVVSLALYALRNVRMIRSTVVK